MKKVQVASFLLIMILGFSLSYAQDSTPTVSIRNTFQAAMTSGNEVDVEVFTATIIEGVEYDGIIFDIDVSESQITLTFDVSDRAMMDPSGIMGAERFERYYVSFEGLSLLGAEVDESNSGVLPTLSLVDESLLIEFSEGMELGLGNDVVILIETESQ